MKAPDHGIPKGLRELLVCPRCREDLLDDSQGLACTGCQLVYPVVDGIPYLLEERGRKLRKGENG